MNKQRHFLQSRRYPFGKLKKLSMRYCCSLGLRGILLFSFLRFKLKNSLSILLSSRDVSSLLHFSQWAWILFDLVILHWGVGFKQSRNSKNKSPETPMAKQKNKKKRTQPEKTQKGRELKTTFKCNKTNSHKRKQKNEILTRTQPNKPKYVHEIKQIRPNKYTDSTQLNQIRTQTPTINPNKYTDSNTDSTQLNQISTQP